MIKAVISIRAPGQTIWPEVGMTNRLVITRSSVQAVCRTAGLLADGNPCRVWAWPEERFYVEEPDTVVFLNCKGCEV